MTVGANVTTYSATGLSANTTYYYRVRATNAAGDSANTSTASATTQDTIPAAPSGLTATAASSSQINLSWTNNANNQTGFKIDQATNSDLHDGPDHGDGRRQRDQLQRHRSVEPAPPTTIAYGPPTPSAIPPTPPRPAPRPSSGTTVTFPCPTAILLRIRPPTIINSGTRAAVVLSHRP